MASNLIKTRIPHNNPQPASRKLNPQCARDKDCRQHGCVVARKLPTRKTERHHPQQKPEEQKVTTVSQLATKQQRQANYKPTNSQQRQLHRRKNEIEVNRNAIQPIGETLRVKLAHELIAILTYTLPAGEQTHLPPRLGK